MSCSLNCSRQVQISFCRLKMYILSQKTYKVWKLAKDTPLPICHRSQNHGWNMFIVFIFTGSVVWIGLIVKKEVFYMIWYGGPININGIQSLQFGRFKSYPLSVTLLFNTKVNCSTTYRINNNPSHSLWMVNLLYPISYQYPAIQVCAISAYRW